MANEENGMVGLLDGKEVIRHGEKAMANLGAWGIIRESFNIYWEYARVFVLVQLTLSLPLFILGYASIIVFIFYLVYGLMQGTVIVAPSQYPVLLFLVFVISLPAAVLQTLPMAANAYAVGLIYAGRSVTFFSVLKGAILRAWPRIVVTYMCWTMLVQSILYVFLGVVTVVLRSHQFRESPLLGCIPVLVAYAGLIVTSRYLRKKFMYNSSVCVFDETSGWAALKAGRKLLQGRERVASRVQCFFLAPYMIVIPVMTISVQSGYWGSLANPISWNPTFAFSAGFLIVIVNLFLQMIYIADGVTYVAFKAYHGETIFSASFLEDMSRGRTNKQFESLV